MQGKYSISRKTVLAILFLLLFTSHSWAAPVPPEGVLPFKMGDLKQFVMDKGRELGWETVEDHLDKRASKSVQETVHCRGPVFGGDGLIIMFFMNKQLYYINIFVEKFKDENLAEFKKKIRSIYGQGESKNEYDSLVVWNVENIHVAFLGPIKDYRKWEFICKDTLAYEKAMKH